MGAVSLWTAAAVLCALAGTSLVMAESKSEHESGGDDDSDSAPFMVVLQHDEVHSCGGSLVSPRTVLTSAWCGALALWAQAPGAVPSARRRVVRVAQARGTPLQEGWLGAAGDIAVLELERPFDRDAGLRPILTAGAVDECPAGAMCHVVRARGHPPRLLIVDATRVPGDDACGVVASGWPALRDSSLCLSGPTLCSTDRGAGVVCDGQLCGVLSRSGRSDLWRGSSQADEDASCGDVHVAVSVARWRRFLHCAHILRACGREDGECAQQCTERRLIPSSDTIFFRTEWPRADAPAPADRATSAGAPAALSTDAPAGILLRGRASPGDGPLNPVPLNPLPLYGAPNDTTLRDFLTRDTYVPVDPTRTTLQLYHNVSTPWKPEIRTAPPARSVPVEDSQSTASRPSFEFEPNRADFKAGEYGDNAADYGAGEEFALGVREGSGDPAPSQSFDSTLTLLDNPGHTSDAAVAPTWSGEPAPTAATRRGDLAPTWRAAPERTSRAAPGSAPYVSPQPTSRAAPEDLEAAAAHQHLRATAISVRTCSLVIFVFATITLLLTN